MKQVLLFISLLILATPSVSEAQAWTKSKGKGFYKLDFSNITATDIFDAAGEIRPYRSSLNQSIASFYGELGISNKLTAVAYIPFLVHNTFSKTASLPALRSYSFGDVDLGLRYHLFTKLGISVSANLIFGLPTGRPIQQDGLVTGDGEFNQMLKIAAGTGGKKWWTQAAFGVNNRTKNNSDELRYDFEIGYKFFDGRLLAILKINGIESLNNGTEKARTTGLYSNNVEYLGIGPELLFYANKKKTVGISARVAGATKGQNVQAAPSVSGGVFVEF